MQTTKSSRRSFLKASGAAAAMPFVSACSTFGRGDKVRIGWCGIGCQGWGDMRNMMATGLCEVVALCDTDIGAKHTQPALAAHPNARRYQDFRKMLDAEAGRIDAVVVATPDHSHFPIAMAAMKRGLAVFVEKPLAHTFQECKLLMAAEKKYGVVTQMGNQGHSGRNYFQFKEYVRNGTIKDVTKVVCHMNASRRWHKWNGKVFAYPPAEPLPPTLDWDTWLGTVAYHDYSKDYVAGEWRSWFDFGNGALGDWGAHIMDTAHQFLDLGLPTKVNVRNVTGSNAFVYPMSATLSYKFPAKGARKAVELEWWEGRGNLPELPKDFIQPTGDGNIPPSGGTSAAVSKDLGPGKEIYQADGTVWIGRTHSAPLARHGDASGKLPGYDYPYAKEWMAHYENFLKGVLGLEKTHSPFSVSAPLSQVFCLGCIAQRLGRGFAFDPATETIPGDAEANALLKGPAPRKGWEEFYRV